jgi:hypothetical protein
MSHSKMSFRVHAIQRMFERGISIADIHQVQQTGKVIEDYPDDNPYRGALTLGWRENRPIHAVSCFDPVTQETILITVYVPNPAKWDAKFKKRKP